MATSGAAAGRAVERKADDAKDEPALEWTARAGFACYGLVYLVIGWLTAQLAFGQPSQSVSGSGALQQLAQEPLGRVLVWVAAAGFLALVVWEACEAIGGHRDQDGIRQVGGRAVSGCRGVVFAVLGFTAARIALGDGSGSSGGGSSDQGFTAKVLALPFGPVLVAAVGIGLLAFGGGSIYGAFAGSWRKQIDADGRTGNTGAVITWLARIGYVARGVAFGIMGGFVVWAAVSRDPQRSRGLDQALASLRDAPAGLYLLLAVAAGLACFGVFNAAKVFFLRDV